MCGITGIVGPKSNRYQTALSAMTQALRHRGPDGFGSYAFPNCALGHTRLSIVDVEGGKQPLLTNDGSLGISFNGEIYGYQQLAQQLKNKGYVFQTKSDTEVILALYQQYGERLTEHLPGMFAFAIWDEKQQKLFCARDRFGEKPFYYAQTTRGDLVFASEIKAILASGLIEPLLSQEALCSYIKYGYIHPTLSIYSNIHPLPPAHCFIFQDGKIGQVQRYWNLPATQLDIGLAEATEQFSHLLQQAVERQLVADVEVGAFLSGGLDSSTLVCLAQAMNPKIKTFTFGFQGLVNEFPYARAMAEMYQTDHYELEEAEANMAGTLSKIPEIYDEPFADFSAIPTYEICKVARKFGKVVLTGEGADELLGGYTWWNHSLVLMEEMRSRSAMQKASIYPMAAQEFFRHKLNPPAYDISSIVSHHWRNRQYAVKNAHRYTSILQAKEAQRRTLTTATLKSLGFAEELAEKQYAYSWQPDGSLNDALRSDIECFMPGDILVKTDRSSMAHGLELRAPFLDVDFASFCLSLPTDFKVNNRFDKIILRNAFEHKWPENVRRREKQGFGMQNRDWLDLPDVKELKHLILDQKTAKMYDLLPFKTVQQITKGNVKTLFKFLILGLWVDKFGT
jgi:asparagine synthase (glutamine-hydrolysing)